MRDHVLGPNAVEWLGTAYEIILDTHDTGGAMSIVDSVSPAGSGPPRHVHSAEDESFVILSGECEFWIEGETFNRGPGEAAFVARGKEHTFRVLGNAPCRHLVVLTPGGFEEFFLKMSKGNYRIPDDMAEIEAIAARHNLSFSGPPL